VLLFAKKLMEDGVEATLAANSLGPFLLTNLLLDLLIASAPARIINVVSEGLSKKPFNADNLLSGDDYNPLTAYTQSKQAEILFTYELAQRLKGTGVTANCFYPGLVKTNLGKAQKGFRKFTYLLITGLLRFLFTPVEESIKIGLFLAGSKKAGTLTGKFLKRRKNKIVVKSAYNKEISKKLWELSKNITAS
jgi:NAD(P)-dependent dehydrogenase (short-subunit alcohol dehydrogenase family)